MAAVVVPPARWRRRAAIAGAIAVAALAALGGRRALRGGGGAPVEDPGGAPPLAATAAPAPIAVPARDEPTGEHANEPAAAAGAGALAPAGRARRAGPDPSAGPDGSSRAGVTVEVVDVGGEPIVDATVVETIWGRPVETDAAGRAVLPWGSEPVGWVVARSDRHLPMRASVDASDRTRVARIVLVAGHRLHGRVRRSDGAPVPGVVVEYDPSWIATTFSNDPPGSPPRIVRATDLRDGSDDPRGGAVASTTCRDARRATTDAAGAFAILVPEPRVVLGLTEEGDPRAWGLGVRSAWRGEAPAAGPDGVVNFVLDPIPPARGRLTLTIVDRDGAPLPACFVQLLVASNRSGVAWSQIPPANPIAPRIRSDGGAVVADQLPSGTYRLAVARAGFVSYAVEVTVVDGETVDLGRVVLDRGAILRGTVVLTAPAPPAEALVVFASPEPADGEWPLQASATIEADGRFEVRGLAPGRYRLRTSRGDVAEEGVSVAAPVTELARPVVCVPPVRWTVEVHDERLPGAGEYGTDDQRAFAARCVVVVADAAGREVARVGGGVLRHRTDVLGGLPLPLGRYRVRWTAGDDPPEEEDVDARAATVLVRVGREARPTPQRPTPAAGACGAGKCG